MSSSRDDFLHCVRQAVAAGNRPGAAGDIEPRGSAGFQGAGVDPVKHFGQEFTALGGIFHLVDSFDSCTHEILKLVERKAPSQILLGSGPLLDQLNLSNRFPSDIQVISVEQLNSATSWEPFFAADLGITGVDYLVAETGTVVLQSSPHQPRSLSLLPPVHVAIAERRQMVPDLFDLFSSSPNESAPALPSCITFITGPSKTGDIELRLVTGVHGPGEIHVILIDG